jgi:hypothetical protein
MLFNKTFEHLDENGAFLLQMTSLLQLFQPFVHIDDAGDYVVYMHFNKIFA